MIPPMQRYSLPLSICLIALALAACSKYQIGHLLLGMPSTRVHPITHNTENTRPELAQLFPDSSNAYLRQLRMQYRLDTVCQGKTDLENALRLMEWTHRQWAHNGSNTPSRSDALTILSEVRSGKQFRCVEYGLVLADACLAMGIKARMLGLKTKDVETAKSGAGHVLTEVWLREENKWALFDAQFNLMPMSDKNPLQATEFQHHIQQKRNFWLHNAQGKASKDQVRNYLGFISHYLYFFDTGFDQRRHLPGAQRHRVEGKSNLMLVPAEGKEPRIFQRLDSMNYLLYTRNLADFYSTPGL